MKSWGSLHEGWSFVFRRAGKGFRIVFDRLFHVPCRISVPIQRSEGCPRACLAHSSLTPHRWHTFNTTNRHRVLNLNSKLMWFWKFSFFYCVQNSARSLPVLTASDTATSRTLVLFGNPGVCSDEYGLAYWNHLNALFMDVFLTGVCQFYVKSFWYC